VRDRHPEVRDPEDEDGAEVADLVQRAVAYRRSTTRIQGVRIIRLSVGKKLK